MKLLIECTDGTAGTATVSLVPKAGGDPVRVPGVTGLKINLNGPAEMATAELSFDLPTFRMIATADLIEFAVALFEAQPEKRRIELMNAVNARVFLPSADLSPPNPQAEGRLLKARDAREARAREIYNRWEGEPGFVPWQDGGNSDMQDKARRMADEIELVEFDGGRRVNLREAMQSTGITGSGPMVTGEKYGDAPWPFAESSSNPVRAIQRFIDSPAGRRFCYDADEANKAAKFIDGKLLQLSPIADAAELNVVSEKAAVFGLWIGGETLMDREAKRITFHFEGIDDEPATGIPHDDGSGDWNPIKSIREFLTRNGREIDGESFDEAETEAGHEMQRLKLRGIARVDTQIELAAACRFIADAMGLTLYQSPENMVFRIIKAPDAP